MLRPLMRGAAVSLFVLANEAAAQAVPSFEPWFSPASPLTRRFVWEKQRPPAVNWAPR